MLDNSLQERVRFPEAIACVWKGRRYGVRGHQIRVSPSCMEPAQHPIS